MVSLKIVKRFLEPHKEAETFKSSYQAFTLKSIIILFSNKAENKKLNDQQQNSRL